MSDRLKELSEEGVSIWLDDLSRERIESGNLADLVARDSVVGITTNPTIFASALSEGERYDEQVAELARRGMNVEETVFELTTTDVRDACDLMMDTWKATDGLDGRVSIEVAPALAFDTEATVASARELWGAVDRPNLFVKIPATAEGIPAIAAALAEGICINVTLIFGLDRYEEVMGAYLEGLERAKANGHDLRDIRSVASFFVSRVDTEVDRRLGAVGDPSAQGLLGRAGIANARLAYQRYERCCASDRFQALARDGAHRQRPLWASTGVKNPDYPDTMYVTELTVPNTVNTMPEKTLRAFADHGEVRGDQVTTHYEDAQQVLDGLQSLGISYDDVIATLEREGVEKFVKSWQQLEATVRSSLEGAAK
ncbi:MAG TPA: transaldolase [Nocardioidaceae bacterium]|nr:transaldolase [Nocardioidaceae bacterium]